MARLRLNNRNTDNDSAFTLVEIVVSIVLLGLALTVLVGIQSNYIDSYLREDSRTQAAMFGQYILAMMEMEPEPPEVGSSDGDLTGFLKEVSFFDDSYPTELADNFEGWEYSLKVTPQDILETVDAMRRIELTISWGETNLDTFNIIFYMKNNA